jgi:hypothetical protein
MDYQLAQEQQTGRHYLHIRTLDTLPGMLAWLALGTVVMGAIYFPAGVLAAVALLACYSAARFTLAGIAHIWGLWLIRRWESLDWCTEYQRRAGRISLPLDSVHHLVVIPNYQENVDVLRRSLDRLAEQAHARTSISLVLAMEAAEPGAQEKGERLRAAYSASFAHVLVTLHPRRIPGEIQCKSANLNWAIRWAKHAMVDERGYDMEHLVVTTMDADTQWHPCYFASLGVLFATDPQRYSTYWQAPIRYHGNVWAAHPLMRILHAYASAWELTYLAAPWWQALPMSSYSASLRLLHDAGYWDPDAIADEWHMYIKSYFARRGNQRLTPIFLPFLANATTGDTWSRAIKARYRQTFRHAWGAKEIGYTIDQMGRHSRSTWRLLIRVAHDNLLAGAGWVIMSLGAQLPLAFHPAWARENLNSPAFLVLQASLILVTALTLIFWALDKHIRPPCPHPETKRERLYELLSLPLVAVLTMSCVALPVLHAQTRLMLGKPIEFRVTAKQ